MSAANPSTRVALLACLAILSLAGCGGGGGGSAQLSAPAGFTVSGTIAAAAGSSTDSDVNDPSAFFVDNSTLTTAQSIPSPVTLGGYVNQPGYGVAGRSQLIGDTSDIYRITLAANQTIALTIADGAADLNLFLGDINGVLLDSSSGTGQTESLTVAVGGTYLLSRAPGGLGPHAALTGAPFSSFNSSLIA